MERILRATVMVGLSSVLTVALGAVRYKFIALELGAQGIGLLGILTSAASFGVVLFGLGLTTSGVQATAAAGSDEVLFHRTRVALLLGSRWLGGVGGLLVIVLGLTLGPSILPKPMDPVLMVFLGVALAATVAAGGNLALLNGMGRIRALAASNALGSIIGTVVTVVAVFVSGQAGLVAALAAAPIATLAFSSWYLSKEDKSPARPQIGQWWPELRGMFALGGIIMLGLVSGSATQLIMRVWLQQEQGLENAGYFQASWTITSMYLGFVLTSLAVEYYPRISALAAEPRVLNTNVDRQVRVALLLGAPVLLWMMVFSPFVLHVLYAADFQTATGILRWQLFGDILKIAGWVVAFLLLARKARGPYFLAELTFNISYLVIGMPLVLQKGLSNLGMAYVGSYALYLIITLWLAHRETGFMLQRGTVQLLVSLLLLGAVALWSLDNASTQGWYAGAALASAVTVASFFMLRRWRAMERQSGIEVGGRV